MPDIDPAWLRREYLTQRRPITDWRNLIASLEDALRLHRHKPGSLVKLDGYLHERTDGAIGSLSQTPRNGIRPRCSRYRDDLVTSVVIPQDDAQE